MCGRIVIAHCAPNLKKITKINKDMINSIYYKESYNQSPGQYLPSMYKTYNNKKLEYNLEAMQWGIKNKKLSNLLFNSRLDSIFKNKKYNLKIFILIYININNYYKKYLFLI